MAPSALAVLASIVQLGQEPLWTCVPGDNRAIMMKPHPTADLG